MFHVATPLLGLEALLSLLGTVLLHSILLVLGFKITFKLSEFSLDLVFSVFADHFNGPQPLLGLSQLVLFLLLGAPLLRQVDALIDTTAVPLSDSQILLVPSLSTGSSCTACVELREGRWVHQGVMATFSSSPWRSLLVH